MVGRQVQDAAAGVDHPLRKHLKHLALDAGANTRAADELELDLCREGKAVGGGACVDREGHQDAAGAPIPPRIID